MLPLKSDHCYAILDDRGMTGPGLPRQAGIYLHDTRHLSAWRWDFADLALIHQQGTSASVTQYWSRMRNHAQELMLRRELVLGPRGLAECIEIQNDTNAPAILTVGLTVEADFADIFEARWHPRASPKNPVERDGLRMRYIVSNQVSEGIK